MPRTTPIAELFTAALPDPYSRMLFLVALVAILLCSGLWLSWILQSRWLQQKNHPTIVVSEEVQDHIPAFHGVGFLFPNYIFDMPSLIDQEIPGVDYEALYPPNNAGHYISVNFASQRFNASYEGPSSVVCEIVQDRNRSFLCQPTQNGKKVFGSDPSGPIPNMLDPDVWGWQANGVSDQLNFQIWTFLNVSAVLDVYNTTEFPYINPFLYSYIAGPASILGVNQWMAGSRSQDSLGPIIATLPGVFNYEFNHFHATALAVTKRVPLSGPPVLTFSITNRDSIGLSNHQVQGSFDAFAQLWPEQAAVLDAYRSTPGNNMFYMNYALRIADMNIITSTEQDLYGILPFLSDVGSVKNL